RCTRGGRSPVAPASGTPRLPNPCTSILLGQSGSQAPAQKSIEHLLFQPRPLAEQKSFRPIPALALFHDPALKRGPGHPIHFACGNDLKDRCKGGLRQSNRALLLCFHNEQMGRVESTRRLDVNAVPPTIRVGHCHGTPAHHPYISTEANKR